LCQQVDRSLIELLATISGKPVHLDIVRRIDAQVGRNFVTATRVAESLRFPRGPEQFREWLVSTHRALFADTGLSFAGRFRTSGEPAFFGGEGKHGRAGSVADKIAGEINQLGATMFGGAPHGIDNLDAIRFRGCAAVFLERFFRTHPFVDGNGRIARLLLRVAAAETGRVAFDLLLRQNAKARRRYVSALQLAHKFPEASGAYAPLEAWITSHLSTLPDSSSLIEAEPPEYR
jgi:fido (protein-threonine AMPylation protein)